MENVVNPKYYDIDQIQTLTFPDKHKCISLLHMNTCFFKKILILTIYSNVQIKHLTWLLSVKPELQNKPLLVLTLT